MKLRLKKNNMQLTDKPILNNYSNAHTERGHEEEPEARLLHEGETGLCKRV